MVGWRLEILSGDIGLLLSRGEDSFKGGRDECCVARRECRVWRVVGVHWVQASRVRWQVVVSYLAGEGELTVGNRCSLGGSGNRRRVLLSGKDLLKGM